MDAVLALTSRPETPQKDLLRFITCGSVDDGKSTLIGRLLHDSKLIFEDQLSALAIFSEFGVAKLGDLLLEVFTD